MDAAIKTSEVKFYFDVIQLEGLRSKFTNEEGFTRTFLLFGHCSNGETDQKNRFNGREARIEFTAPDSKDSSEDVAKHGVQDSCGHILIRKDVLPKRYDLQEGPIFDPPIDITIRVDHEVLDRLFETAQCAMDASRVLSFKLALALALPAKIFIVPDDLDVSEDRWYPVTEFELNPTVIRLRDGNDFRPRAPTPNLSSLDRARLNVRLDEVRAELHSDRLRFSSARMSGKVTGTAEMQDVETSVEIQEYGRDRWTREYPEEASAGVFQFYPDTGHGRQLYLELHFTRRDSEVLIPIILSSPTVYLSVSLSVTKADLAAVAKESLLGDITSFSFSFCATKGQ